MNPARTDLTLLETVLLHEKGNRYHAALDPKLVWEIEEVASKYTPRAQLAFIMDCVAKAPQAASAYLLDKHQSTISRDLDRLKEELKKVLKKYLHNT